MRLDPARVLIVLNDPAAGHARDGSLRPVDARTAALGIIGLCNWVAWWHRPSGDEADRAVAAQLADMALASVAADDGDGAGPRGGTGLARAVALLKRDVAGLELLVERQDG